MYRERKICDKKHQKINIPNLNLLYTTCSITPQNKAAIQSYPAVCTSSKENCVNS